MIEPIVDTWGIQLDQPAFRTRLRREYIVRVTEGIEHEKAFQNGSAEAADYVFSGATSLTRSPPFTAVELVLYPSSTHLFDLRTGFELDRETYSSRRSHVLRTADPDFMRCIVPEDLASVRAACGRSDLNEAPASAAPPPEEESPIGCPLASCPFEDCDTPEHYPAGPERDAVERENTARLRSDEDVPEPDVQVLGACRACFRWLVHVDIGGPWSDQHALGCALALEPEPFPRTPEEVAMVRAARAKGGIAPPAKMPPDPREAIAAARRAEAREGKGRRPRAAVPAEDTQADLPLAPAPKPPRKPRKTKGVVEAPAPAAPPAEAPVVAVPATPATVESAPPAPAEPPREVSPTLFLAMLEGAYPGITANPTMVVSEVIDGCNVVETAKTMVDLSVACSPVLYTTDSLQPVEVTQLEGNRYRIYHGDLTLDVDTEALKVMRARYLLRRGELTRVLTRLDAETQALVVKVFFKGVRPWTPPTGSPLDRMTGPITIAREPGKPVDFQALHKALTTPGGEVPAVCPTVDPAAPPPPTPPKPAFKVPKAHRLPGEHSRECCFWKVHVPERTDMQNLPPWLKLCSAHWEVIRLAIEKATPLRASSTEYIL